MGRPYIVRPPGVGPHSRCPHPGCRAASQPTGWPASQPASQPAGQPACPPAPRTEKHVSSKHETCRATLKVVSHPAPGRSPAQPRSLSETPSTHHHSP
eukprot:366102-Chlamydomonas_euryale.AAC.9